MDQTKLAFFPLGTEIAFSFMQLPGETLKAAQGQSFAAVLDEFRKLSERTTLSIDRRNPEDRTECSARGGNRIIHYGKQPGSRPGRFVPGGKDVFTILTALENLDQKMIETIEMIACSRMSHNRKEKETLKITGGLSPYTAVNSKLA